MWTARFERLKTLFVAAIRAKKRRSELETARVIAYVEERLQNSFLLPVNAKGMQFPSADHDPLQVRSQGVARHSCRAH